MKKKKKKNVVKKTALFIINWGLYNITLQFDIFSRVILFVL